MPALPFDTVIFDMDGTLADTAPDLASALNRALAELGRPAIAEEQVRNMVGHGARALVRKGLAATGEAGERLVKRMLPLFLDAYSRHLCVGTSIYPGLEKALDELAVRGVRLGVCTNKPEALTHTLLAALGCNGRFPAIVGGDTLPVSKPDPAPLHAAIAAAGGGQAVLVGDSITDADTARAARIPFVAVSFGFSDRPASALGADIVIDHYDELIPALESFQKFPGESRGPGDAF